jgi:peptidoglycan LD-endopeptidase LytH
MKILYLLFIILFLPTEKPFREWEDFEKAVRDAKITKTEAKQKFPLIYQSLKTYGKNYFFESAGKWTFPISGYSKNDVGKGGFRPEIYYGGSNKKGYDFYDGNKHGGHPAYDIFIHDKNQDCIDDKTQKPANIVAPVNLIILSVNKNWAQGSALRGGNYIWAFNPELELLFYFSHLGEIKVATGEYYKKGSALATVGRSGKNAAPSRSPTHLHFMILKVANDYKLIPFDYYEKL